MTSKILRVSTLLILILSSFSLFGKGVDSFRVRIDQDHQLTLLNSGNAALEKRLQLIESAVESIELETFIFNTDLVGRLVMDALVAKRKEGVRVRLLLDHFLIGSQLTPFHAHEMEELGIEVRYYNTLPVAANVFEGQYRNHRKSLVIDGKVAIVGGRNIADEYFDLSKHYNFNDREVYVEGEVVTHIQNTFNVVWDSKPVERVKRPKIPEWSDLKYKRGSRSQRLRRQVEYRSDRHRWKKYVKEAKDFFKPKSKFKKLRQKVAELAKYHLPKEVSGVCPSVSLFTDRPGIGAITRKTNRILKYEVFRRMRNVKDYLAIDSAYFVVDKDTGGILENLLDDRDVAVDLHTNGLYSTDAFYVASVFNSRIGKWLEKGLTATIYSGDVMPDYPTLNRGIEKARWGTHSKTYVFDDEDFLVGSYNFDPRSNEFSLELGLFCNGSKELTNAVKKNIAARKANGIPLKNQSDVKKYEFENVSFFKRLGYYLVKIPAALFDHLL